MSGIRRRLKALEGVRHIAPEGEGEPDGLDGLVAEAERQACLMLAWLLCKDKDVARREPISSVLPKMLRYVDEAEARRLLAMDYTPFYSAAGMPNSNGASIGAKPPPLDTPEKRTLPKTQVPGRTAR